MVFEPTVWAIRFRRNWIAFLFFSVNSEMNFLSWLFLIIDLGAIYEFYI